MTIPTVAIIIGFFVFCVVVVYLNSKLSNRDSKDKKIYHYGRKDYIMTNAEHDFYDVLTAAAGPEYLVLPQANLSVIFDEKKVTGQNWTSARRHINQKSVDYLICDKQNIRPLVGIELDDWSHEKEDRKVRDSDVERIFEEASMPLLRFANNKISPQEVKQKIDEVIQLPV